MEPLLDAVLDLVALVSPTRICTVASALRGLTADDVAPAAHTLVDTAPARAAVDRVLAAWKQSTVSGDELAGMLVGASEARLSVERELSVELVWTGPTTRFVPTRRTEQVLIDLIASAQSEIFVVSFVAYDVRSVVKAMNEAVERGVRLRVLLEASASHGGTLEHDHASTVRASVPGAELLTWRLKEGSFVGGKVHAKVALVDGARAFITSANLTSYALGKNIEAGVLVHGGPVPQNLSDHLQALIDVGVLGPA